MLQEITGILSINPKRYGKVFIETFECRTKCQIFTGKDALKHAVYWIKTGEICDNANDLWRLQPELLKATSWHKGCNSFPAHQELVGDGVHMKIYEEADYLIYSSQNNLNSPLFEHALVFQKRESHSTFFERTFKRAKAYSTWWKKNKDY